MCIIGTSCLRHRHGTSTILGTIIFIGILFTAVIPMFLFMRQADTLHEQRKHELELLDQDRGREELRVYVLPVQGDPPPAIQSFKVEVENRGDIEVKLARIWINSNYRELGYILQPRSEYVASYEALNDGSYFIIVTTDRGNLFVSDNAMTLEGGEWVVETVFAIYIQISSTGTIFNIVVEGVSPIIHYDEGMVHKLKGGSAFKIFKVDQPGKYHVTIKTGPTIIYDEDVEIKWPIGPSVEWVDA